eukprot:2058438-Prymnesium_polylepis.1
MWVPRMRGLVLTHPGRYGGEGQGTKAPGISPRDPVILPCFRSGHGGRGVPARAPPSQWARGPGIRSTSDALGGDS